MTGIEIGALVAAIGSAAASTGAAVASGAAAVGGAVAAGASAVGGAAAAGLGAVGTAATGGIASGWAATAIGAGVLGSTGMSMHNSVKQGNALRGVYQYNADVMEAQARAARQKVAYDKSQKLRSVSKLLGSQYAAFGGAGVVGGTGSALDIAMDTTAQGDLEAAWIEYSGRVESDNYLAQAESYRKQGSTARKQGWLNAGMTLLGSAASLGMGAAKAGMFGGGGLNIGGMVGDFGTGEAASVMVA